MRLIDADKFEEFIRKNCTDSLVDLWCELVRRQPTIEVVPAVEAEWIVKEDEHGFAKWEECSRCGLKLKGIGYGRDMKFCYACGTKMKGGAE